ncbi:C2H2 type zinc-finger-domain-containing protein [Xylariaceae sp. FL0594]|nr:C2H2 type zinc-finger-domain-containing protein [Xylariaceae sp. FL0594]
MVGATTTATATATATGTDSGPSLPMNQLSSSSPPPTHQESTESPVAEVQAQAPAAAMQPFVPGQCLFCPTSSPTFEESVQHMRKCHGLFIPYEDRLAVDLETLFKYLHLVIYGYRECIHCGTERATVQAVQQHMMGKGHCRFGVEEEDSEFAEFYDFTDSEKGDDEVGERDEEVEGNGDDNDDNGKQREEERARSRKPVLADEDSIRLPSGRIISRHYSSSSVAAGPPSSSSSSSSSNLRRRIRGSNNNNASSSRLEYVPEAQTRQQSSSSSSTDNQSEDTRLLLLSKREKRVAYQLANLSANDRTSLMHLPPAQQRALLLTQQRQEERIQKAERRRQGKIDRKGNKNLYAYWHTETPVYQCG